jgi:hypothetical protein
VKVSNALDTYDSTLTTLVPSNTPVSATSTPAILTIAAPQSSNLTNLSVRALAGTGDQTLIAGFAVSGNGKPLLIRGIGPGLAQFGVTNVLADPQLAIYAPPTVIGRNDNWGSAATSPALVNAATNNGAFGLTDNSLDAALLMTIDEGTYSVQVSGSGSTSGIVLAELYDTAVATGARLTNLSVRGSVGTGDRVLIVGFTVTGTASKRILIRGIGPGLAPFGVSTVIADPQIAVFSGTTVISSNDNWGSTATAATLAAASAQVGAFALADGSKDAALAATFAPGSYTVQLSGVAAATGVGLIELYELP